MGQKTISIVAETMQEARDKLKSEVPDGMHILSEKIISDGKQKKIKARADSTEQAFKKARSKIPAEAIMLAEKELLPFEVKTITIEAADEKEIEKKIKDQFDSGTKIKNYKLLVPGKKGFLGIGKTLNQYEVQITQQAEVEISYKTKVAITAEIGEGLTSWKQLLSISKDTKDSLSSSSLLSVYPHQILFVVIAALQNKVDDDSYFKDIPFGQVSNSVIKKAQRYIDKPPVPSLMSMFGIQLPADRYSITRTGDIQRKSNPQLDGLIVTVADCLKQYGNVNITDYEKICNYAFKAIMHYSEIPIASYFFLLPYLDRIKGHKNIIVEEAKMNIYKGVEGLLFEMYDELGEGQVITESRIKNKIKQLMS
ncbi:hypothetical protein JXB12_11140 [candidate division KSB1 bacterium]|nr:hypothetical protein [candidate division KSB1 bacterium]